MSSARHPETRDPLPCAHGADGGRDDVHDRSRGAEDILHRLGDLPRRIALVQMILGELDEASRTEEPAPAAAMQKILDDSPDEITNSEDSCRHVVLSRRLAMPCSGRMGYSDCARRATRHLGGHERRSGRFTPARHPPHPGLSPPVDRLTCSGRDVAGRLFVEPAARRDTLASAATRREWWPERTATARTVEVGRRSCFPATATPERHARSTRSAHALPGIRVGRASSDSSRQSA